MRQFPGGHLKLKVDVRTAIVPFPISEATERDITTGNSSHQRDHRRHFCRGGAARLELNSESTHISSNDEVERRGISPTTSEADLSRSSIFSFAHRRRDPRSLEPIVRSLW